MTSKVTKEIINKAKLLGNIAFANGEGQVPAKSKELNSLMSSLHLKIGEGGIEIMQAFIAGWHEACDAFLAQ